METFDILPEENCVYTCSEVFFGEDHATGQTLVSVKLKEIPARPHRSGGFSAWRFRPLDDGLVSHVCSLAEGAAAGTPDDLAAAESLAADPTTDPTLLAILFRDGPPSLGWVLATNPNTPGVVLHELWKVHPLAVLENPILAYQTLSNGRLLYQLLPLDVMLVFYAALRNDGRTEEVEIYLPEEERIEWGLRCGDYPECDGGVLAAVAHLLVTDSSAAVRKSMAEHLDFSFLLPLTVDPVASIRVAVARRGGLGNEGGEALMDILACDPEEEVRVSLAGSSWLTPASHERLAADPSQKVLEKLARERQRRCDITETGWRLLVAGGSGVCLSVARNPSCPESVRLELTAYDDPLIRGAAWRAFDFACGQLADQLAARLDIVFGNPALEEELLAIAENSKLTGPIINRLLQCSENVTRTLAANANIPMAERGLLLRHHDDETVAIAMANIHGDQSALISMGFRHSSARVRAVVAGIAGRRAAILRPKLAMDPSLRVRLSVWTYLSGKASFYKGRGIRKALEILSRDRAASIRARVVGDLRLPQESLAALFEDRSAHVRLQLLAHRCHGVRKDLGLLDHKNVRVRVHAARLIISNQGAVSKRGKGETPESDDPLLDARIARDPSPMVREVAAASYHTSLPVLEFLIDDSAPEVQRALTLRFTTRGRRSAKIMNELENSRSPYERAISADISGAGKERLQRLAADPCWLVRAVTAKCGHNVDIALLETLADDAHPLVREYARGRLKRSEAALAHRSRKGGRP